MANIDRFGTFYSPWPVIDGKSLNLQWGELRSNHAESKAVIRNSYQELQEGQDELNAIRALLGQAYGDIAFSNKYRFYYNKSTFEFCLQKNDGTVETPVWVDLWCVRFSDGQFQVSSEGGIQSDAGFYGPGLENIYQVGETGGEASTQESWLHISKLFFNQDDGFELSRISSGANQGGIEVGYTFPIGRAEEFVKSGNEWTVEHNFGVSPVMVQVMDGDKRVVIPDLADVSDPNTAYFYFHASVSGSVYIATGGIGAVSLVPRDPFYLVVRTDGQPSDRHLMHPNADLTFDSNYFYVQVMLDEANGGAHKRAHVSLNTSAIGITDLDGLSDVTLGALTDGEVLTYDSGTGQWRNEPSAGGGVTDHGALTGLADDDHPQYARKAADWNTFRQGITAQAFYVREGEISSDTASLEVAAKTALHLTGPGTILTRSDISISASGIDIGAQNAGVVQISTEDANIDITTFGTIGNIGISGNLAVSITANDTISLGVGASSSKNSVIVGKDGTYIGSKVKSPGFYLAPGVNNVGRSLNIDSISIDLENPATTSYFIDSFVPQGYIVEDVAFATTTGSCTVGFYILSTSEISPRGIGVAGCDPFYIMPVFRKVAATGGNVLRENDSLVMSVFESSGAEHLRGRIRIRLSG